MRGARGPEDLPRLLAALGLADDPRHDPDQPRGEPHLGDERVLLGLDYWLPTSASLAAASEAARGQPPPRAGQPVRPPPSGGGSWPSSGGPETTSDSRPGSRRAPARVLRAPDALVGSRVAVPVRTALVVLVVVVLVGALYAGRVLVARAHDRPVLAASSPGAVGGVVARASPTFAGSPSGPAAGGAAPMTSAPETSGTVVVVDVVGQVRHPGVYRLRSGQRVDDAVRAAGGVVSPCDVAAVNLARPLLDGEQIRVPRPGESVVAAPLPGGSTSGGSASGGSASGGSTPGGSATVLVNLNAAGLSDLDALPGVGPVLAQRILDWRAAHGRFTAVDELGEVAGIGEKLLSQLRPKVSVRGP